MTLLEKNGDVKVDMLQSWQEGDIELNFMKWREQIGR